MIGRKKRKAKKTIVPSLAQPAWQGEYADIQTTDKPTLPAEIWDQINRELAPVDQNQFARICKGAYSLGVVSGNGNTFYNRHIRAEREAVRKLLLHVVKGEQSEVEAMIQSYARLLLEIGRVEDYSGRIIEGTALGMALGADDVSCHEDEECMAEMIQRYLKEKFADGEKVIAAQIREQFPDGWEKLEKERAEKDLLALKKVTKAIAESTLGFNCENAIREFRHYLQQQKDIVKTGKHFNIRLFIEAIRLYDKNRDHFDYARNNLYWCKVIGYIQRYLPACYAQALCQDVRLITKEGEKLSRSLTYRLPPIPSQNMSDVDLFLLGLVEEDRRKEPFYPLDSQSCSRLGHEMAVGRTMTGAVSEPLEYDGEFADSSAFADYVKQKTAVSQALIQQSGHSAKTRCLIM